MSGGEADRKDKERKREKRREKKKREGRERTSRAEAEHSCEISRHAGRFIDYTVAGKTRRRGRERESDNGQWMEKEEQGKTREK